MNSRLAVLNLFLRELGQDTQITTKADRLRIQKAIYLGQLSGVDLGYRYSWYVHGPYSPALTQDYYALSSLSESERTHYAGSSLNQATRDKLQSIRPLLEKPVDVDLEPHNWLELLSSWHYLRRVNRLDVQSALDTLQKQKPHVAHYAGRADQTLRHSGFI